MNPLIAKALDCPTEPWPPDYYRLLALTPGALDTSLVESAVLQRMERLRAYQLAHPEPVTDAMNLLAQALVTLTDPVARAAYDLSIRGNVESPGTNEPGIGPLASEVSGTTAPAAHQTESAEPNEQEPIGRGYSVLNTDSSEGDATSSTVIPSTSEELRPLPVGPIVRAPSASERNLRGEWLGTGDRPREAPRRLPRGRTTSLRSPAALERVRWLVRMRKLLEAWDVAGDWLAIPDLSFATRTEVVELVLALRQIASAGPSVVGDSAGRSVVELARTRPTATSLLEISDSKRQALAEDWRAGRKTIKREYREARARVGARFARRKARRDWARWKRSAPEALLAVCASITFLVAIVRAVRGG